MLVNTVQFLVVQKAVVPGAKFSYRKCTVTPFVSLPTRMAPAPPPLAAKKDDRRDSGSLPQKFETRTKGNRPGTANKGARIELQGTSF